MFGAGLPVALQRRVTLSPSTAVTFDSDMSRTLLSINKNIIFKVMFTTSVTTIPQEPL